RLIPASTSATRTGGSRSPGCNAVAVNLVVAARVIPFFADHGIALLRILTDRGKVGNHAYQLYRAVEDVDHSRTEANSAQTNGICKRFHRTIKDAIYDIAFCKKLYRSVKALQVDLDVWLVNCNEQRPHSGKYCYVKTPVQTFRETLNIVFEKTIRASDMPDGPEPVLSHQG
ncbi:integrase core domain-containing protein, partial [Fluviibacterium sp. DFM31]